MRVYKKAGTKERLFEMFEKVNKIKLSESVEVHYSDGMRQMKKFNNYDDAVQFSKEIITNNPKLKHIDIYNNDGGFNSTAQEDKLLSWWGDGSYWDNVSKKNPELLNKKLDVSDGENGGNMKESFDSPIKKDEKYLDKTVGDETSQVSKYDDGTRYPVEDKLKVKDPSLEKLKGDDAPIQEKWDTDYETPKSERGKYDGKTQEELKSMLSSLKKSGPHHKGSPEYEKEKELMFALRAKHNFGKVSEEDDQTVADENSEENDNKEKPAWDEDFGGEEEVDVIPSDEEAEDAPELDNEIENGGEEEGEIADDMGYEDSIDGGLADDAMPSDFDPEQIAKGIKIEMEHTDDPHKALEIAMDHLTEISDYYDRLENMEAEAKQDDAEAPEDSLLNPSKHWVDDYSPKNVDENSINYPHPLADPEAGEEEWEEAEKAKSGQFNDNELESLKKEAQQISKKEGVTQHVNVLSNGKYKISDWYDADSTVASYDNGREIN